MNLQSLAWEAQSSVRGSLLFPAWNKPNPEADWKYMPQFVCARWCVCVDAQICKCVSQREHDGDSTSGKYKLLKRYA